MSDEANCKKCGSKKKPVLCISRICDYADVDSDDPDYEHMPEIMIDAGVSIWMHVCRECHSVIDAGIEERGILDKTEGLLLTRIKDSIESIEQFAKTNAERLKPAGLDGPSIAIIGCAQKVARWIDNQ